MSIPRLSTPRASAVTAAPWTRLARPAGWDPLLVCVAGLILTIVGRVHLLFPFLTPLRPAFLLGLLGLALLILDLDPARKLGRLRIPSFMFLVGLMGWMTLSVPFALREFSSLQFLYDNFSKTVILYALVVLSIRSLSDAERLAWAYLFSAAIYAAVILARFQVGSGSWRLEDLYTYDPNDFAVLAVTAIPIGLVLARARRGTRRVLALGSLVVIGVAFVWAGSRGGFLALASVIAYLLFRYRAIPARWRMLVSGLIAAVVFVSASAQFWERMQSLLTPQDDYNLTSETGRLQVWKRGWGYMLDHPLVGVGANNFRAAEGVLSPHADRAEYGVGVKWSAAHNSYLQVGAELGFPGLLLFVAFLVATFRALRRPREHDLSGEGPAVRLAQGLRASLIGFLVGAFFLSLAYSEMVYTLAALSAGVAKVCGSSSPEKVRRTAHRWPRFRRGTPFRARGPT